MPSKKRHLLSRLAKRSTRLLFLGSKRIYIMNRKTLIQFANLDKQIACFIASLPGQNVTSTVIQFVRLVAIERFHSRDQISISSW